MPVIDEIQSVTKVDQAVDLKNQSLLTRDGKNIVVSGTIRYHIDRPHKALLEVYDMDVTLSRVGLGVIADYVNTKTLAECTELEKLKAELMMKMCEIAKEWGIHVDEVYVTDIGTTFNLRLLTNTESGNGIMSNVLL
jgi:regulator of protease activity HflC (stomatin/prohibitin superfamily)